MSMGRIVAVASMVTVLASSSRAADLTFRIEASDGATSATVGPGCRVVYRVVGDLSGASDGLALWHADLFVTGPAAVTLPRALRPVPGSTMGYFDMPLGVANPPIDGTYTSGYGGALGPAGTADAGTLLGAGGAQNTIRNNTGFAPFPTAGSLRPDVAQTAQVLMVGTLTMPTTAGTYTLAARNVVANVIRDGELGTPSAEFFKTQPIENQIPQSLTITVSATQATTLVTSTNRPQAVDNPHVPGAPFRDVLQTGTSTTQITQGIGASGTPVEGSVQYATIQVNFCGAAPNPAPAVGNIVVSCTDAFDSPPGNDQPCPTVTGVSGSGSGPYQVTLSGPIPTRECTSIRFATGDQAQYQYLPGDVDLDGTVKTQDILALIAAMGTGPTPLSRYDINRDGAVDDADITRLTQLLNGTNTTEAWNSKTVAACP